MNDLTEFRPSTGMDTQSIERIGYGMVHYGPTDDKLIVGFYRKSVLNKAKSREQGKPVHEGQDFVKIEHPGETLNKVDRPVLDNDKLRFPRQWAMYQAGKQQVPDGIPISLLFPTKPEIEATLRGYNIHTVEQLAGLSAQGISTVGLGCQEWVNAAARYIERAEKGVSHHKFESAMAAKDQEIGQLKRQIDNLARLIQQPKQAPNTQNYDFQTAQIDATHQSVDTPFTPEPAQFVQDLSSQVVRRGRPPGSKNKPKEN